MKYCVGYRIEENDNYINKIIELSKGISEVYFAWGDFENGRNSTLSVNGITPWEAQQKQMRDLKRLSEKSIGLNMLFNAMCYGEKSQSRKFFQKIGDTIEFAGSEYNLLSITTTSPLIARFTKENFPEIEVRASVNMNIGSIEGMEYVSDVFDSFYLQREKNRNFAVIRKIKNWCDANGKQLFGLANSGCLNNCSAHTFHDNLVSHEAQKSAYDNGYEFFGVCRKFLKNNPQRFLDVTGFIRPEDTVLYENLFDGIKLATRVIKNPYPVLEAYIEKGHFSGNLPGLLEPDHSGVFYPYIIENSLIKSCVKDEKLIYYDLNNAKIKLEDGIC